jgi:uncharacterized protein YbaR (Trm112 family)/SAM-dependent methyltransferase
MRVYKQQKIENMRGEVVFRQKLAKQHVEGETVLPTYCSKQEVEDILRERLQETTRDMAALKVKGLTLSPFVELGAERCQRSLVMTNDFGAEGFAVDISFHQLKTAEHFAKLFNKPRMPHRICCDANHLPFKKNSIPFAFCYASLHHFPSVKPVIRCIHEILSAGCFFFEGEPIKRPKIRLYEQKTKIYSSDDKRGKVARFLESFLSQERCDEVEHGVIENADISMSEWTDALSVFDSHEVTLSSLGKRIQSRLRSRPGIMNLPNALLGGGVRGVCRKESQQTPPEVENILDLLTCPECGLRPPSGRSGAQPSLARERDRLRCEACGRAFPIVDGIMVMFPRDILEQLYPEFC